jgi:hypothetical protein
MRPSSRGQLGSSGGLSATSAPPGTSALRPGSGRSGSNARLRTGVTPTGPGTIAAGGIALQTSVNVSDRPVTGQGMMGMKPKTGAAGEWF